ncbi:MAG: hypothetical protein V7K61_26730 [Nostoc sp.]
MSNSGFGIINQYAWVSAKNHWKCSVSFLNPTYDRFIIAMSTTGYLASQQQRYRRLFLLPESLHHSQQPPQNEF